MIAKALARRGKARFFSVSASVLTSKWLGEGEKLVKALFLIARYVQPAVIFVDEIDSLLSTRKGDEHEASRRLKTEFLVQMDGAMTSSAEQVLVLAATNRPFDLDEAILRRLVKRIYVPLPDPAGREAMICQLLKSERVSLTSPQLQQVVSATQNMSYSDLKALCAEAAMSPLRELSQAELLRVDASQIRAISHRDFVAALQVRPFKLFCRFLNPHIFILRFNSESDLRRIPLQSLSTAHGPPSLASPPN
jgi:SpoVK/Ycf46/Vps4 family AAA+-type ATPase